jgi:hypothetical protein
LIWVAQNKEMKLFRMPSDYSRGDIALLIRIGSIFWTICILGGARGFRQKKLQK